MSFLTILLLVALLTIAVVFVEVMYTYAFYGFGYGWSSNRVEPKPRGRFGLRIQRTLQNQVEATAYSVPVLTVAAISGLDSGLALTAGVVHIIARAVFVALYFAGVPFFRALAWVVGWMSIAVIGYVLVTSGAAFT